VRRGLRHQRCAVWVAGCAASLGAALEPLTSVADAANAATTSAIVILRNRRGVSQEKWRLPK
jgi:hypothetical protein